MPETQLSLLSRNSKTILHDVRPPSNVDIAFSISAPALLGQTQIDITHVLKAIARDDKDFPLLNFNWTTNKWVVEDPKVNVVKQNGTPRVLWLQCTYTPGVLIKLFRQAGWDVDIYDWRSYEPPPNHEHAL